MAQLTCTENCLKSYLKGALAQGYSCLMCLGLAGKLSVSWKMWKMPDAHLPISRGRNKKT